MTDTEQIAYVRRLAVEWMTQSEEGEILHAVCDLAERALVLEEALQQCEEARVAAILRTPEAAGR